MKEQLLYTKYDFLLPRKFDGGYLVIALYEKIKNREIEDMSWCYTPLRLQYIERKICTTVYFLIAFTESHNVDDIFFVFLGIIN